MNPVAAVLFLEIRQAELERQVRQNQLEALARQGTTGQGLGRRVAARLSRSVRRLPVVLRGATA